MSEEMFKQAVEAAKAGQRTRAKDLLTRLIKADATKIEYWLWMSGVVETEKEKVFCLQNAIKIDPNNLAAKRGLVTLGQMRPEQADLTIAPPALDEASVELPSTTGQNLNALDRMLMALPGGAFNRPRNRLIAAFAVIGLGIAALVMCVAAAMPSVFNWLRPRPVAMVATNTPPPAATATVTETPTPEFTRAPSTCFIPDNPAPATPLAVYLCLTQTPTPFFLSADPARFEESYDKVEMAYLTGNWALALEKAEGALLDLPDNARLHFYIAEAYRHTGDTKNALKYYRSSIAHDKTFAPAFWGKAIVDVAQGLNAEAVSDWDSALKADPAFVLAYLDRATYHSLINRDMTRALADLETARRAAPDNALVAARLAEVYVDTGALDLAASTLEQALAIDPGLAYAYFVRGRWHLARAEFAEADRDLSIAYPYVIALDALFPSLYQAQVYYAVGAAKAGAGDDASALTLLTQSITIYKSGYPLASVARGNIYLRQQDYQSAREDFNTAIGQFLARDADNPALADAYIGLGQAFLGLDRPDSAVSNFQAATRRDPSRFAAQLGLGQTLVLIGGNRNAEDAVEALTIAQVLTQIEVETAQVLYWRAQAHRQLKHTAEEAADWAALTALGDAPAEYVPTAVARLTEIVAASFTATPTPGKGTPSATPAPPTVTPTAGTSYPAQGTPTLTPSKVPLTRTP